MKKQLHIATSPLTNTIFCGHLLKDGKTWASGKQDITNEAIIAVVEHALTFKKRTGKDIVLSGEGLKSITITVSVDD